MIPTARKYYYLSESLENYKARMKRSKWDAKRQKYVPKKSRRGGGDRTAKRKRGRKKSRVYYVSGPFKNRAQAVASLRGHGGTHKVHRWGKKKKHYYGVAK